ncbi:MAG: hypothetical protein Q6363_005710 [Candidatus Njordarchaeota archaeon]
MYSGYECIEYIKIIQELEDIITVLLDGLKDAEFFLEKIEKIDRTTAQNIRKKLATLKQLQTQNQ